MSSPSTLPPSAPALGSELLGLVASDLALSVSSEHLPPGTERRWVQLASTDAYDAWLIGWPPGTGLGLHDHGDSSAAIAVVDGTLHERRVAVGQPGIVQYRTVCAGDSLRLGPEHLHSVRNDGAVDALSVHVYSPPLRSMNILGDEAWSRFSETTNG